MGCPHRLGFQLLEFVEIEVTTGVACQPWREDSMLSTTSCVLLLDVHMWLYPRLLFYV